MSETTPKRSQNYGPAMAAETNDASRDIKPLLVDPSTGRLLVDASVTVSGLATAVTDGEAVDAADVGNLALGTDGANYQVLHTDSSGDLQIDVLTSALPTGASTLGEQQTQTTALGTLLTTSAFNAAFGTAGTADSQVLSIQGITSMTPVQVGDNSSSLTVDGTVAVSSVGGTVAVTQSGTWDEVGINDSGNVITVDGSGSAGTAATGVVTIQGIASMTPVQIGDNSSSITVDNNGTFVVQENGAALTALQLIDDGVYTDDTSTHSTGSSKGYGIMAVGAPTDAAVNANDIGMVGMTVNRELYAYHLSGSIASGAVASGAFASGALASGAVSSGAIASGAFASGSIASGAIAAGAIAAGDTSIATTEDTARAGGEHLVKVGLARLDTPVANAGVSNDGDYTSFIADNFGKTWVTGTVPEDTGHVAGEAISTQGSRRIATLASSAGSDADWATVNQTAEGGAWSTLAGTASPNGLLVANFTSGDTYTALTNTAQVIKASAGNMYGYYIYNPNASATYVMVYNIAAASVTVGTSTATLVFAIPATGGANLMFPVPIPFSNAGWSIAAATTGGGNSAPSTALEAMIFYL